MERRANAVDVGDDEDSARRERFGRSTGVRSRDGAKDVAKLLRCARFADRRGLGRCRCSQREHERLIARLRRRKSRRASTASRRFRKHKTIGVRVNLRAWRGRRRHRGRLKRPTTAALSLSLLQDERDGTLLRVDVYLATRCRAVGDPVISRLPHRRRPGLRLSRSSRVLHLERAILDTHQEKT